MKLNTNSNAYIIIYSAILVVVVAFLLAFVYQALKPMQDANVALDVKKQILYSLNIRNLDGAEAEAKYAEVVKEEKELDGQKIYECQIDGQNIRVASLKGMGLWGGISGYVAIDKEGKVFGAYFNHESETAGLGAEIKDSQAWQEKFIGKKIFNDNGEVVLSVVKKVDDPITQVDCVTGATLTSNGVDAMLIRADWPVYDPDMDYAKSVKRINATMAVTKAVRNIRAEAEAVPSKKLNLIIKTDRLAGEIQSVEERIKKLANVVEIKIEGSDYVMPDDVMTAVIDGAEIAVKLDDLVDRDAEIERLTKEKARLESEVARVEKKLANKGFTDKAPAHLVDAEREKGVKYKGMLETVIARLESLK